ncbi:MAG: hypothetical protein K0R14_152 [Burkholderiales bacterium]|jgi:uncharacterized membrane protein|nr:hypothetical protein [Burkholderiales bacterium]
MNKLKTYIFAGLLVWLPIGLTIWSINLVIHLVDSIIPTELTRHIFGAYIPGIGILVALVILLLTGIIATNFLGQKLLQLWDKLWMHIPIVKSIYKGIKQVSDTLLSSKGNAFRRAILIKFPNTESWTIAFITGTPSKNILGDVSTDYINVYVPTTPNPTSGYFVIVHRNDTKELNMTVDQALRYVISMGAVDPSKKQES